MSEFPTPPPSPRRATEPGDALGSGGKKDSPGGSSSSSQSAAGGGAEPKEQEKFNLRGSARAARESSDTISETIKSLVEKTVRRLDLSKLTNKVSKYPGWRNLLENEILGCGLGDEIVQKYIDDMNSLDEEEIKLRNLSPELKEVDNNVYRAVAKAVQGADDLEEIENKLKVVPRGHGRYSVRILDKHFQFDFGLLTGGKAADSIFVIKAKNMPELGAFAASFRVRLKELDGAGTPLHSIYGIRHIKRGIAGIQDTMLKTTLSTFAQKPKDQQDMYGLLNQLELVASEWKTEQERDGKQGALGATGRKEKKKEQKEKKILEKEAAAALLAAAGIHAPGKYGGKGAGKGKQDGKKGTPAPAHKYAADGSPICDNCGIVGHMVKTCRKQGGGAYQAAAGYQQPWNPGQTWPSGGSSGSTAAAGAYPPPDPPGTHPPCPTCKKTNHAAEKCIFKGKGKGKKSGGSAVVAGEIQNAGEEGEADLGKILTHMLAKKAGIRLGGSAQRTLCKVAEQDPAAAKGLAAKWLLDCGANLWSTNAQKGVKLLSEVRKSSEPHAVLGHSGVNVMDQEVKVEIPQLPHIDPTCTLSRKGPNMVPFGRLIYQHGYRVRDWSRENDLLLEDPQGELVQTHIDAFCPYLGAGPTFDWQSAVASVADWVEEIQNDMMECMEEIVSDIASDIEGAVEEIEDEIVACVGEVKVKTEKTEDMMVLKPLLCENCEEQIRGTIEGCEYCHSMNCMKCWETHSCVEGQKAKKEMGDKFEDESKITGNMLVKLEKFEFVTDRAKALRTVTNDLRKAGAPDWADVVFRETHGLDTCTVLESLRDAQDITNKQLHEPLDKAERTRTVLYFSPKVAGKLKPIVPVNKQKQRNPVSQLGNVPWASIPTEHLLTHFEKLPWCEACEVGKIKRSPAYRVPHGQGEIFLGGQEEIDLTVGNEDAGVLPRLVGEVVGEAEDMLDEVLEDMEVEMGSVVRQLCVGDEMPQTQEKKEEIIRTKEETLPEEEPELAVREFVRIYLRKVYIDLLGPTEADIDKNTGAIVSRDQDSGWPDGELIQEKTPEVTLLYIDKHYPGDVKDGRAAHEIYCDNGPEFQGVFSSTLPGRGTKITNALEGEPTTNSYEERFHDTFTRCIRASMKQGGGPIRFRGRAFQHTKRNLQCTKDGRKDQKSPFRRRFGYDFEGTLVPWACRCTYFDSKAPKFTPHGRIGIVMQYKQRGGFEVLDVKEYVASKGNCVFITTKHLKMMPRVFPFREIEEEFAAHDTWSLTLYSPIGTSDLRWYTDTKGRVRCIECNLLITDAPITCALCLGTEGDCRARGRPKMGCRKSRCKGHEPDDDDEQRITTTIERVTRPAGGDRHWRVRAKSPRGMVSTSPRERVRTPPRSLQVSPRGDVRGPTSPDGVAPAAPDAAGDAAEPNAAPDAGQDEPPLDQAPEPPLPILGLLGSNVKKAYFEERSAGTMKKEAAEARTEFSELFETDHDRDVRLFEMDMKYAMGNVMRMINVNSKEAQTNPRAQEALKKEVNNFVENEALDILHVMEKDEAARRYPDGEYVDMMMLLGQRHAEVLNTPPEEEDWKARGVIIGCNQRDVYNRKVIEEVTQTIPASMQEQKLGHTHQSFFPDGIGLKADVNAAYLTTLLGGKPKLLHVAKWLYWIFPAIIWTMTRPVVLVRKAFYGFKRAGADYGERAKRLVKSIGFKQIRDVAMSVFVRWPILLILYIDDLNPNGPKAETWKAYWDLSKILPFSDKDKNVFLDKFIGLCRVHISCSKEGTIKFLLHQMEHIQLICRKYMKLKGLTGLKRFATPIDEADEKMEGGDEPGEDGEHSRMFVGDFLFVGRGSRPEALYAIGVLGRAVAKWCKRHDRMLFRLICYFHHTSHWGLVCFANPKDLGSFGQRTWWDATLGSPESPKSIAGYGTWIVGRRTKVLLDAGSRIQEKTEVSTPGSETVAGAMAVVRSGFPLSSLLEQVYERDVELELGTDNTTTELDINQGYSKGMKHMRKHHKLSISLFGEAVDRDDVILRHLPTGDNTMDILTKALSSVKFHHHRLGLGVGDPEEFGDEPDV